MIRITILQIQLLQLYGEYMVRPSVAATDCRNDLCEQSEYAVYCTSLMEKPWSANTEF